MLAYRLFLDPLPIDDYWYLLLIPISIAIAIAYKAVRVPDMREYPRQVIVLSIQIIVSMMALGIGSYIIIEHILPVIAPR
ncbi:MAG: hypothetical protein ACK54H_01320 [Phycisphaerales bacterium]|jgi:hypothetical protein